MKPISHSKSFALTAATVAGILLLPSWSPPSPDLKVQVGNQTNASKFRGFVGGTNNTLTKSSSQFDTGFGAVLGDNNTAYLSSSVLAGLQNTVAEDANSTAQSLQSSGVFGNLNTIEHSRSNLLVAGSQNTVNATHSFVAGNTNTINGVPIGTAATNSAAIGQLNNVASSVGWAVGYQNTSSGTRSLALGNTNTASGTESICLGKGLTATQAGSVALGRYNAGMQPNDVLVVGSGETNHPASVFNALRVTGTGQVILGKAQGDISMGAYSN